MKKNDYFLATATEALPYSVDAETVTGTHLLSGAYCQT
jgi:hypothetical protein